MCFHLYEVPRAAKFMETEIELWVPGAGGGGKEELLLNGDRVSVLQDEKGSGD